MTKPYSRTILFVREVPWNSHFAISTKKIAEQFAKNEWNVIWLTPPLMPWHRHPKNKDEEEIFRNYEQEGIFYQDNIFAYSPRSYIPFSRKFPFDRPLLADIQWSYCFPSIPSVLKKANVPSPDFIWLSTFHSGGLKKVFPQSVQISHVHDNFSGYSSAPKTCKMIEQQQYKNASIIFAATSSLKRNLVKDYGISESKIHLLPPAVSLDFYSPDTSTCPEDLLNLPQPRLVAVGNTSKLDYDILEQLLLHLGVNGSLIIIGEINAQLSQMALKYSNLRLVGSVESRQVANYLLNCDIGLILMGKHMEEAAKHTCPMKLYEYAAAGLPVLSSPLPIYKQLRLPIKIITDKSEIPSVVNELLDNVDSIRKDMLEFASINSWSNRYKEIEKIIFI